MMADVLELAEMAGCASTSVAREVFWWKRLKEWGGRLVNLCLLFTDI
jgi:hypothetical protein